MFTPEPISTAEVMKRRREEAERAIRPGPPAPRPKPKPRQEAPLRVLDLLDRHLLFDRRAPLLNSGGREERLPTFVAIAEMHEGARTLLEAEVRERRDEARCQRLARRGEGPARGQQAIVQRVREAGVTWQLVGDQLVIAAPGGRLAFAVRDAALAVTPFLVAASDGETLPCAREGCTAPAWSLAEPDGLPLCEQHFEPEPQQPSVLDKLQRALVGE